MKAIGLMSGTSMDGIDVALLETDGEYIQEFGPRQGFSYSSLERQLLLEATESARGLTRKDDRSGILAMAETLVTQKHIEAVTTFASTHNVALANVDAVGFHGQTVAHYPERGFSVQLGNATDLSKALCVPVVFDFRSEDLKGGGQGAPLVPVYHQALALRSALVLPAAFVNIGGISNVTYIGGPAYKDLIAFDAGPGNALIDDWAFRHTGVPMDRDGKLAMTGTVNIAALERLISHPYFRATPPKSLDRGTFHLAEIEDLGPADGAATLTAFTVACISAAVRFFPKPAQTWIVTGGGSRNPHIVESLKRILNVPFSTADEAGFSSEFMEAQAFAYLAVRSLRDLPSSFPGTTGVGAATVAGRLASPAS